MRRALVIGAQTGGLSGVNNDAADVAAWLTDHGFAVDLRVDSDAIRDGILDGMSAIIANVQPGDPAIVYYAGHGGIVDVDDMASARLGFLVPTDHEHGKRFRGILELEWSARIVALTKRTRNVVVIHDCCHAARTVRDGRGMTRALEEVRLGSHEVRIVAEALSDLGVYPLGNPDAIRFAASSGRGQAWEQATAGGRVRGVFTRALLEEAAALEEAAVSWAELGRRVRERVLQDRGRQRPEIEGPTSRRVLSGDALDVPFHVATWAEGRHVRLAAGMIHGVESGDVFRSSSPRARVAVISQAGVFASTVAVDRTSGEPYPRQVAAALRTTRYPVVIEADEPCSGAAVAAAISNTPRLCTGDAAVAMARVQLARGELTLFDEHGLLCAPIAASRPGVERAMAVLSRLAATCALQRTAAQFEVSSKLGMRVERITDSPGWLEDGAELGTSDRICVHVANHSADTLWLHLFAVGPAPALEALGPVSSGVELGPRSSEVLGAVPGLGRVGFQLAWPADALADRVRPMELIAIATTQPVDLSGVVWPDVRAAPRSDILAQVHAMPPTDESRRVVLPPAPDRAYATRRRLRLRPSAYCLDGIQR